MAKVSILDLKIRIWTPLDPEDVCLAKIGDCPILFQGKTPGAVRRAADEWRKAEVDKAEAQQAAAAERARKRQAERGAA